MNLEFVKMHGAGNDFIMIDNRNGRLPLEDRRWIVEIANRPDGIGCEGVIVVTNSEVADFRMMFFNPDGSEAELCGNGARCVAVFAREIGVAKHNQMRFETLAGEIAAEIVGKDIVKIRMPLPCDLRKNFVNSGVPHCIVVVDKLDAVDVVGEGRKIRYSEEFAPNGTNVDFVHFVDQHSLDIRTYERGVEAETGACGTGSVAAAVVGVSQYGLSFPVAVTTIGGYKLIVDGDFTDGRFKSIYLLGPVKRVFRGEINVEALDIFAK